ncbi:facilitated trehalose transporter Tret1-2 homolog [Ischnura elegans]|uniref:facilitated trehalose transporter Tret1-2 homolog n=1 Tax=Ischnura elegans TaxID=197161 RepID=UPI001ED88EB7|nr:facilitated trehalose transporter Tret1-2 homolog [Ischnura elegans]
MKVLQEAEDTRTMMDQRASFRERTVLSQSAQRDTVPGHECWTVRRDGTAVITSPDPRKESVVIHPSACDLVPGTIIIVNPTAPVSRSKFSKVSSWHLSQVLAALAVSLGPFSAGLGKGYSSPALASLQDQSSCLPGSDDGAGGRAAHVWDLCSNDEAGQWKGRASVGDKAGDDGIEEIANFALGPQGASWVASVSLLGAVAGAVIAGAAISASSSDAWGRRRGAGSAGCPIRWGLLGSRRRLLVAAAGPASMAWLLAAFARSLPALLAAAFVAGLCCAVLLLVTQVYVSEIASPAIRGALSALLKASGHLGSLVLAGLGAANLDWRHLALVSASAPAAFFLLLLIPFPCCQVVPETPSHLLMAGDEEEAARTLKLFRGPTATEEMATLRANVHRERRKRWHRRLRQHEAPGGSGGPKAGGGGAVSSAPPCRCDTGDRSDSKSLLRPILTAGGLVFFQRFSGAHAFNFYAVPILRQTLGRGSGLTPHEGAVAVGAVQFVASLASGLLMDTIGRVPLLLFSSLIMSLTLGGFGAYILCRSEGSLWMCGGAVGSGLALNSSASNSTMLAEVGVIGELGSSSLWWGPGSEWVPLLCVFGFTISFCVGIGGPAAGPGLLASELFPLERRGMAGAMAAAVSHAASFAGVKTFVDIISALGLHGAFFLYAGIAAAALPFVLVLVPETRGKPLQEMDPCGAEGEDVGCAECEQGSECLRGGGGGGVGEGCCEGRRVGGGGSGVVGAKRDYNQVGIPV